jgi:GNAT superfamily N-acetyltransferase
MKGKSKIFLIAIMVLLIFISMVIGTLLVIKYIKVNEESFGAEAAVGAFSLIATLIGTFFVAYELKNTGEVTCCEMLINLNNYFHDSDRLMRVYAALDNAYLWGKNGEEVWQDVEEAYRGHGIAGALLNHAVEDMKSKGVTPLYLVTDHIGFYERYGWKYFTSVMCEGEDNPSRMYIHR